MAPRHLLQRGSARPSTNMACKGMMVSVRGRIHYSKWTDKDQVERYGCEIIAEDVQFLSRGKQAGSEQTGGNGNSQLDLDDDVPF